MERQNDSTVEHCNRVVASVENTEVSFFFCLFDFSFSFFSFVG